MTAHQVHIGAFDTRFRLRAAPDRAEVLRKAIDHAVRDRLPDALRDALDPVLDGADGVIRIRDLHLDLTATNPLDSGALARIIAARLAEMLRALLRGGRDGLRLWPSHDAYMADYVMWRLGLRAGADWAFTDFAALAHIPAPHAAAEIIAARPSVLTELARGSGDSTIPRRLIAAMEDEDVLSRLLRRLAPETALPPIPLLQTLLATHAELIAPLLSRHAAPATASASFALLVRILAALPSSEPAKPAEIATFAMLLTALAALPAAALARATRPGFAAGFTMTPGAPSLPRPLVEVAAWLRTAPDGPDLIAAAARLLKDTQAPNGQTRALPGAAQKADPTVGSPHAGLALLVPPFLRIAAGTSLTDRQRNTIAAACLPDDLQQAAAMDPGLLRLFPFNPRDPAPADWPVPDPARLAQLRDGPSGHLLCAGDGPALWAEALTADFAARLPGLKQSSRGYLQMQFLNRPGDITTDPDAVAVALAPLPLGIVLSMGGLLGFQGKVPWLDNRPLTLSIKGGT